MSESGGFTCGKGKDRLGRLPGNMMALSRCSLTALTIAVVFSSKNVLGFQAWAPLCTVAALFLRRVVLLVAINPWSRRGLL